MLSETEFREFAEHHPLRLLNIAARHSRHQADRLMGDLGLTATLFPYLLALYWQNGQSQRELSEFTVQDPATTVRSIDRLEVKGLVERRPAAGDRRLWNVYLTRKGKDIQEEILGKLGEVEGHAIGGLDPAELDDLVSSLAKIIHNLGGDRSFPYRSDRVSDAPIEEGIS